MAAEEVQVDSSLDVVVDVVLQALQPGMAADLEFGLRAADLESLLPQQLSLLLCIQVVIFFLIQPFSLLLQRH